MKFRLVDQITAWSPYQSIRGVKSVSFEEYQLKEAFGGAPSLPESLLLESFLQLGNWLLLLSSDFALMAVAVRLAEVRFEGALAPGQRVVMDVRMTRRRADGFQYDGEGRVAGRLVISGQACLAAPVPAGDYADPEDLRILFSEIYRPETPGPS